MCDEEDLYVVIIGDEDSAIKHEPIPIKEEVLDEEELREIVENLLEKAEEHGEIFKLNFNDSDITRIQEEQIKIELKTEVDDEYDFSYEDAEYLNDYENLISDNAKDKHPDPNRTRSKEDDEFADFDEEYIPDEEEFVESDQYVSDSSEKPKRKGPKHKTKSEPFISGVNKAKTHPRRKMLSSKECKSYVKELKQNYPELRNNKELLISCLVEVMKSITPPPPPDNYYVVNDFSYE